MARLDDPTLHIDRPRPDFRAANPEVFGRAADAESLRRLSAIERRASDLKDRFRAHFERHEVAWVLAEAVALSNMRSFPTLQHPRPPNRPRGDFTALTMTEARRNVHARALQRLSALNTTKTRLQNAVIRNAPVQSRGPVRPPSNNSAERQKLKNTGQ